MDTSTSNSGLNADHGGGAPFAIGGYDVLLDEEQKHYGADDYGKNENLTLKLRHGNHVGNNRFRVMIEMHRSEYNAKSFSPEHKANVVEKIVDILCRQCVPPARFLVTVSEQSGGNNFHYGEEEASVDRHSSREVAGRENGTTWQSLDYDEIKTFVQQELNGFDEPELKPSLASSAGNVFDSEKKRRRRSSLLRRSVSETDVSHHHDDKRKAHRTGKQMLSEMWNAASLRFKKEGYVAAAQSLDVVFREDEDELLSNHTGNNRLDVLIELQRGKYSTASEEEQNRIISDLIETVSMHWRGRFLREVRGGGYLILDENQVELMLGSMMQPSSSASATSTPDVGRPLEPVPPAPEIESMRQAAVEFLEKRKKRMGLTSRIRNLTANMRTTFSRPRRSISVPISTQHHEEDESDFFPAPEPIPLRKANSGGHEDRWYNDLNFNSIDSLPEPSLSGMRPYHGAIARSAPDDIERVIERVVSSFDVGSYDHQI